ncbi:MAG: 3-phosphoshikimate 1-carboxyvinyltransferase [Candidatus Methylomirabilia bacterium]
MRVVVRPHRRLDGTIQLPGDKSISHRAAIVGSLAVGPTEISRFLEAEDCLNTLRALEALGVEVTRKGPGHYRVEGVGLLGLQEPESVLDCGNSGTSARLLLGMLAGQPFSSVLTGDDSLRRRPMERVTEPLARMGATVVGRQGGARLPLAIRGRRPLRGCAHRLPVASAQAKSALLLAGLAADGPVTVEEPAASRNHTELILARFGAQVEREGARVALTPGRKLRGQVVQIPGDFSSAAFFIVAGCLIPDSRVVLREVGVNPTRTGLLDILSEMGGRIEFDQKLDPQQLGLHQLKPSGEPARDEGEPIATLTVTSSRLRGARVGGPLIPRLVDELPILAVAAAMAEGVTEVTDAKELRVKESDRIRVIATELAKLGVLIEEREGGFLIRGRQPLTGARVHSHGDHRMAMALVVAGLVAQGSTVVEDVGPIATSFPEFLPTLLSLVGEPCLTVEP